MWLTVGTIARPRSEPYTRRSWNNCSDQPAGKEIEALLSSRGLLSAGAAQAFEREDPVRVPAGALTSATSASAVQATTHAPAVSRRSTAEGEGSSQQTASLALDPRPSTLDPLA